MIKRIIFDLDNTLIPWNKDWNVYIKKAFEFFNINITEEEHIALLNTVANYEKKYNMYDKYLMTKEFGKTLNKEISIDVLEKWIEYLKDCYTYDETVEDVLKYLSNKYELVVLTNWFTEQQKTRLEKAGYLKYISEVIGTDKVLNKPNKEAILKAINPLKKEECVMIGDDVNTDIKGAMNIDLNYIFLNINGIKTEYKSIKNLEELKEIL